MSTPERIRALHVDDKPEFAELTAEMLEREDDRITVTTATSAGKGLDRLADRGFDCIISDYEMPGMDGIEFLERVREEYDTLPFILFTGKGSEEVASDAIFAGVTDYLQKETGTGQYAVLANRVANAVEQYRAKQRVRERERELQRQNERLAELVEKHEAAETRYRSLFENAPIVVWEEDFSEVKERVDTLAAEVDDLEAHLEDDRETLLALADTIEINDVNEYAVEHYDAPSKEALMENLDRLATEQSYEAYKEEFLALAAGETQITLETQAWTLDGDLKDELLHVFVPEAYAGDYSRAYITATDITERKEKERALEKEREFIEQSLDTLDDIFYLVDTDGDFERWNSTLPELTGYSDDEISAMNSLEFFEGEHRETIQTSIRKILETESHVTEAEITTADGRAIPHEFRGVRMTDSDGDPTGIIGIARDITERKRREERLVRQNEQLEEFVGVISHDLRNPLNVAESRLSLAAEECDSEHLTGAADAITRSQALIEDLLRLAREDEEVTDLEPLELADVAEHSWETVETGAAKLNLETTQVVHADRSRLRQLFENLYRNASEHGGDEVMVHVGDVDSGFYVADTGSGIPESDRDEVFDAGYSTADDGTGFGLRIVKQIAEAHGWKVTVTESDHGGARFEITGIEILE